MSKRLIINVCSECPFCRYNDCSFGDYYTCEHNSVISHNGLGRYIQDTHNEEGPDILPKWCPLDDADNKFVKLNSLTRNRQIDLE